ncbi:MAG: response regulator [Halobacteriales archaeon]|nr:response regulator [Halobacteriales archaeon]
MAAANAPQVLVVEDEPDLADLYSEWLSDAYDVRVAYEGKAALEELSDAVDVVLLDRRIPDLPGDEVLEQIRARGFDCRVAMVTAVTPDEDIVEMGFDDYLVKPVSREDLHEVVERLLRRSTHTKDVREFFSLASKKAVLDAESSATERESSEAYQSLEAELREMSESIDATLEDLEHDDFEVLFYDLQDEAATDPS